MTQSEPSADPSTEPSATPAHPVWTLVGLSIALLGAPVLTAPPFQALFEAAGSQYGAVFVGQSCLWLLLGLTLAVLVFGERERLAAIGLKPPRARSLLLGVGVGVGAYAALLAITLGLIQAGLFDNKQASAAVLDWPLWLRLYAALSAGLVEEILYRGYAIERLTALLGRRWLAAIVAIVAFALAHAPFWGLAGIGVPLFGGVFFTLIYLWRRDLILCMCAHAFIDVVSLVILPMFAPAA